MFRAQRNGKFSGSGEKIDFKFSNLQALQVPKLWDILLVSIISVETGKTIARSNKALVRNGNCQWTETLSVSIWIQHHDSSKELEEHIYKFVVSMGSTRSGILGETTFNMARYHTSVRSSSPVSLPLKKCNYSTILQVKIQCLTPTTKLKHMFVDEDYDHAGSRSNGSAASLNLKPKSTSLLEQIKIMETSSESSVTSVGYSKNLVEAAEDTIEENHELLENSSLKIQELEGLKVEQEARITDLENESNITSICLENLRNDLMVLNSNFDSQVSAKKLLEQRAANLEKLKCEMELSLFETEEENIKLLERVSDLESQLTRVKDEHEVTRMECEYVKSEKQKLQESAENLIEECNKLQKSYEDITNGMQNCTTNIHVWCPN
ncbi:uncharacterized protein LOC143586934 [Bidens hawaiensis]|uniref:uncharacterized protein LOC143586934 n=1 Tax=Bidens hawaiensis TaxID=980011 RepID=UPI004049562A